MSIFEAAFAFALAVFAAGALVLAASAVVARRRQEVHIAPFEVAGEGADATVGAALANMLRARLVEAQREAELRAILSEAGATHPAATLAAPLVTAAAAQVRGAVEPVDIDFSVGKVSVGGLLAWAQRWALERQTVRLTVVFADETATVSGTLEPFGVKRARALWSTTTPDLRTIVDAAADAILQSRAAESDRDGNEAATALAPNEFADLLWCLNRLALHERRARFGQSITQGTTTLEAVRERLACLTEAFPEWEHLAQLAEDVGRRITLEAAPLPEPRQTADQPSDEAAFLSEVRATLDRLFPDGEHPTVVFGENMMAGLFAIWNSDEGRYEVNPRNVRDPGFALDIALMGRLMMKNYDRCDGQFADVSLWNDFRNGVVDYLAETDPEDPRPENGWFQTAFRRWLRRLEKRDDAPPGAPRELAFALLDAYACSWTWQNVRKGVRALNDQAGSPVPPRILTQALRSLRPLAD
jgi:hypothetical protein